MKNRFFLLFIFCVLAMTIFSECSPTEIIPEPTPETEPEPVACSSEDTLFTSLEVWQRAAEQLKLAVKFTTGKNRYPRSLQEDGTWYLVKSTDWTAGFFPGNLWQLYEYTGDDYWQEQARNYTAGLESNKTTTTTHDLGFMMYNSFGQGYRLAGDENYKQILVRTAQSLATRYNPTVGCIKSWDLAQFNFPVIIDNMMNLELLFWATKASGDSSFYQIAESHALSTIKSHVRPDNSVYHVVDFNGQTGEIIQRKGGQGYSETSSWARGQGWGLYGFTMCYRETGNPVFLETAENIANYVLDNQSAVCDIPYWDFSAPGIPNEPVDASAAAVICSGLIELSQYSEKYGDLYLEHAKKILTILSSSAYLSPLGSNKFFILQHSVGNYPRNSEIDTPIVYADYYFLEALLRLENLEN